MPSSVRVRRRRTLSTGLLLFAIMAALAAWLFVSRSGTQNIAGTPRRIHENPLPSSSATTGVPTTTGMPSSDRGLPVTAAQETIVDSSRSVVRAGVIEAAERTLPTDIWMPSAGGRYPLVVFVHGFNVGPTTYERFLSTLASAGYVVAAPSFPLEDPSRGFGLDRSDLPNEATDVSFVLTAVLGGPLASHIDASRIAVVGHSDGADVALMIGYQTGKQDLRVRAIVADAPDPITGQVVSSSVPLLLIQGNADSVVPYASSLEVFQQVMAPCYYVTLVGADHLPPIAGGTSWTPSLDTSVADFLDATVAGRNTLTSLTSELSSLPLAQLRTHA